MSEPTVEIAAVPGENQEEPPTEDGDAEVGRTFLLLCRNAVIEVIQFARARCC